MKRKVFFAVAMMALLLVAGCDMDDDFDGNGSNGGGKQLSKLTWVYNEGYSQTYVEEWRFTWNGNRLTRVEDWDGNSMDSYTEFSYNGSTLSEFTFHETGKKGNEVAQVRLTYSGNRLSRADVYVNGVLNTTVQFTCNSMNQITGLNANNGDFVMNFTWENGDVVRRDVVSEGYNNYTYDNHRNPFNDAFALYMMFLDEGSCEYMSSHNLTYEHWTSNYDNYSSSRSYTLTYTDDYPATRSYSGSGGSGTYHYYYTDGTGSNYTGGGSQQNYTVSVSANNSSYGYVTGGGTYPAGSTVTLTAYPYSGYQFTNWSDGNTQNPRTITVNGNVSYTAYFTTSGSSSNDYVAFGSTTWSNVYTDYMHYYSAYNVLYGYIDSRSDGQMPYIYMQAVASSAGTNTLTADDNGRLSGYNRLEYYDQSSLYSVNNGDTTYYGDWWAKNVTVTFNSLNTSAGTANLSIYATMFSAYEAYIDGYGIDGASTRNLTINLPNLTFEQASKVMAMVKDINRQSFRRHIVPANLQAIR